MTCPRPGCGALIVRVERCEEFRTVRYRWGCAVGHSGFLADDAPDIGRPVEPWGKRAPRGLELPAPAGVPGGCLECPRPLPPGSGPLRRLHEECAIIRQRRRVRTYDRARQAERRSPRRKTA